MRTEAERRAGRVREALLQAREARRMARAAACRLIVARVAMRFGRFRRAYEAASEALALVPGSPHAAAIRGAAVAAIGVEPGLDDDATVGGVSQPGNGEPWAAHEETVGAGSTAPDRAPD
jgi:hypothetical protein